MQAGASPGHARLSGLAAVVGLLVVWIGCPAGAEAHAFGQRYDLPLPLGFYLAAAGFAVLASFLASFFFLRASHGRLLQRELVLPPVFGRSLALLFRLAGLLVLAVLLGAAFFGPPSPTDNLATVGVWVIWWVGFFLFSALLVDLWAAVDPFRGFYLLAARAFGRDPEQGILPLPRAAAWIAFLGLLAISWVELISERSEEPRALGILILVYAAATLLAAWTFGLAWFRVADPLGRLFALLGRLAPLSLELPERLLLSPPAERLTRPAEPQASSAAFVVALIGIVLFDGISETPLWAAILEEISGSQSLRPTLLALRDEGVNLLKLIRTLGLLITVALSYLAYRLLAWTMAQASGRRFDAGAFALGFAASLLPIAVAYHLAHYISYLLLAGQLALPALADPFALGWSLVESRQGGLDIGIITARQVWWIAVAALVTGHVLSVLVAHRQALTLLGDPRLAVRSQLPMMVFMTGLTMLSLWILSQPIVA